MKEVIAFCFHRIFDIRRSKREHISCRQQAAKIINDEVLDTRTGTMNIDADIQYMERNCRQLILVKTVDASNLEY